MTSLLHYVYSLLIYLLVLPVCGYFFWRSRKEPGYRQRLHQRFALQRMPQTAVGGIVVHAVSVGEVVAATPLIKALQRRYPQLKLTISCTTPTAAERIVTTFGDSVYQCYLPLDTPGSVSRWLNKLQPQALVILETELWPNLLLACRQALIPTFVVNARLSARSARGYRRWYALSQLALTNISVLLTQDRASARRFAALGCNAMIKTAGNLKFDMAVAESLDQVVRQYQGVFSQRRLWVAGSTHDGEDELLLQAYKQLKPAFPDLLLVLVPRHPQRFDQVAQMVRQAGLNLVRRSEQQLPDTTTDAFLGDSMGELLAWYQMADVVFIGGSLIERGGHNPLEAMLFGKPIQSGTHVFNFAQAFHWLDKVRAINWVKDVPALVESTKQLLSQPELALAQGQSALQLYQQHGGATQRMDECISDVLGADAGQFKIALNESKAAWYQADVFQQANELSFSAKHWQARDAVIGQSHGRNIAWFIQHRQAKFVLRHYYRGGLVGKFIKDSFRLEPVLMSRAMQEFALLRHMQRCNLPVPRPLAAQYVKNQVSYQSDLMIELIPDSQDLASILASGVALSDQQWQQVGQLIARFHQYGVYHSDLNCHNILLDKSGEFWLIDFDKCAIKVPGKWQQDNLARLLRSLQKERAKNVVFSWEPKQWSYLLKGYRLQLDDGKR